ncbi:MAG: FHA domain-containing protein [Candidatus Hydrogenedentes bacterium]|nr:FHA domain-containing protein [Candidatus Hydrogenedentota bacterium]
MIQGDTLELLSGPEDGTQYPLAGGVVDIGSADDCGVQVRLDGQLRPHHARLTNIADTYAIRCLEGSNVLVNGKRVGRLRSQVLQNGGLLQVGDSLFFLHGKPGAGAQGQAQLFASDLGFFLKATLGQTFTLGRSLFSIVYALLAPVLSLFKPLVYLVLLLALGAAALFLMKGWLLHQVFNMFGWLRYYLWNFFSYIT